jgi:hypothetical protein
MYMNPMSHKTSPVIVLNSCSRVPLFQLMDLLKSARPYLQMFCLLMSACHTQTLPVSQYVVAGCIISVLFLASVSGYTLVNASRRAAKDLAAD